jgi:hypothetical protein
VRGALLRTLPGRAIVVGLAVKLAVFFVGVAFGGVPCSSPWSTRWPDWRRRSAWPTSSSG